MKRGPWCNVAVRSANIISLCTGGAGLDLGIELAMPDARAVCLVEREAFAVAHLVAAMQQGLLAQAPVWSDVTTFNGRAWRGLVDGVIGGIPCQPHSLAGKRLAEDDERDLWSDARRIIIQSGAWFVLIENVEGMLTSGGAERVWRDLGRLGFEREVGLFSARSVGASHQRNRTFILGVADPGSARLQRCELGGSSGQRDRPEASRPVTELRRTSVVVPICCGHVGLFPPGPSDLSGWRDVLASAPELEPAFRRVADGLASRLDIARVDRLRMLGNGVVSLEGAYAFRTLATRLAGRGSTGAARLVRMIGEF
ncbi:DNA cytosine methyltransferase [Nitrobacter sp.]|uniref:DNA cytosine methyltransferase n=1 Tax=Nitrobacter sp. TaxID=29420 RepID=UPI003F652FAB